MWPKLVDMTRDESMRVLRRLELEAYATMVDVLRAQGFLTKDKKHFLEELQNMLSISKERHRAEIRRAVNDEHLATIAEYIAGPNNDNEWLTEGRRLIPLLPRLIPQTHLTPAADHIAHLQYEKNLSLPLPQEMNFSKEVSTGTSPPLTAPKGTHASSPSNMVIFPSGKSILIKGSNGDETPMKRRRRRTLSGEATQLYTQPLLSPPVAQSLYSTLSSRITPPITITLTKPAMTKTLTATQTQKVILVSSSGQTHQLNASQKSQPVIKTITSTGINPAYMPWTSQNVSTNQHLPLLPPSVSAAGDTANSWSNSIPHMSSLGPRSKGQLHSLAHQVVPQQNSGKKPMVVMPVGGHPASSSHGIHVIPVHSASYTPQHKPEPTMKIINPNFNRQTSSRIISRSQIATPSASPVVVSSAGNVSSGTVLTRSISSTAQPVGLGSKILSITNQGGRMIATSTKGSNVVTVNPKTLHLTAVKSSSGSKPSVIVVQKGSSKKITTASGASAAIITKPTSVGVPSSKFEKELVSFIQKQETKGHIVTTTALETKGKAMPTSVEERGTGKNQSLLAELITSTGKDASVSGGGSKKVLTKVKTPEGPKPSMDLSTALSKPEFTGTGITEDSTSRITEDKTSSNTHMGRDYDGNVCHEASVEMLSEDVSECREDEGSDLNENLFKGVNLKFDNIPSQLDELPVIHTDELYKVSELNETSRSVDLPFTESDIIVSDETLSKNLDLLRESLSSATSDLNAFEIAKMVSSEKDDSSKAGATSMSFFKDGMNVVDRESVSPVSQDSLISSPPVLPSYCHSQLSDPETHVGQPVISKEMISKAAIAEVLTDVQPDILSMDDLSSRDLLNLSDNSEPGEISGQSQGGESATDAPGDSTDGLSDSPSRSSKRKRKVPLFFDDEMLYSTSWSKMASDLLTRMCHFRGSNKDEDDHDVAHWFLQPVDTETTPDYKDVVKTPMDFGTIKSRLEMNEYGGLVDFHRDMLMVYQNCLQYNPPGHHIRRDCEELFAFYADEYKKMVARLSILSNKRMKMEKTAAKPSNV